MGNPKGVKRDFDRLEVRRLEAVQLLDQGLNQSEVGRRLQVSHQTVSRWQKVSISGGAAALRKAGRAGRKPELAEDQTVRLVELLRQGPERLGYRTPLWTTARVADLIQREFEVSYHPGHVWKVLRRIRWSCQRPQGRARERNEQAIADWKRRQWPAIKKKAQKEGRTIVFIDESGIRQRPHRVRTWAPRGETPLLEFNFNWSKMSAIAGLSFFNFYFQLLEGAVTSQQVIDFLGRLGRYLRRRLLIVWDGLSAHKSKVTRDSIASQEGRIAVEYLPGYAPELNPVEYIWSYWKQHELPNVCPKDMWELDAHSRAALRRMRRRPRLITAFWAQAELSLE
jgi:transposase